MRPRSASPGGRRRFPLGPEQGLEGERVQQRAFGVALPDAAQHMDGLCQPLRGDDAQSGTRVEEEQDIHDLWRHGEVAQDEVEGAVRGGVEGLAGVEDDDVVGSSSLEVPLRHEDGSAGVGAREGPLLQVADHSVPCEHFRDALGEEAREQLHVQLAQGYGSVVVQPSRARYLGAEPYVCVPPVHRRLGIAEDGPVGVDQSHWTGAGRALMKRASTWLGPGALPSALSRADCRSCMEYCWTPAQAPLGTRGTWRLRTAWKPGRSTGRLSYSSRQKARTANITSWASVRNVWVLGTRRFQRADGPGASTSMAPRTAFHRWAMSWAWRHEKSLMARLRSAAKNSKKKSLPCLSWRA